MTLKGFKGYNDGIAEGYAKALDDVNNMINKIEKKQDARVDDWAYGWRTGLYEFKQEIARKRKNHL